MKKMNEFKTLRNSIVGLISGLLLNGPKIIIKKREKERITIKNRLVCLHYKPEELLLMLACINLWQY